MPTDSEQKVVEMTWRGTKVAAQTLAKIIRAALKRRNNSVLSSNKIVSGQQSLKKLNRQNKALGVVSVTDKEIQVFKHALRQQHVDFSIKRDSQTGLFHFYFKAQDSERIYEGLKRCVGKLTPANLAATNLSDLLSAFKKRAASQKGSKKHTSKKKSKGHGHAK